MWLFIHASNLLPLNSPSPLPYIYIYMEYTDIFAVKIDEYSAFEKFDLI